MVLSREVPKFFLDTACCSFYCKSYNKLVKEQMWSQGTLETKDPPAYSLNRLWGWEEMLCFVANEKELWVWDFYCWSLRFLNLNLRKRIKFTLHYSPSGAWLLWSVWKPYSKPLPSFFVSSHLLTEITRTLQWPSWVLHRGNREISVRTFMLCFERPIPGQCRTRNSESIFVDVIFLRAVLLILGGIAFAYVFVRFLLFRSWP